MISKIVITGGPCAGKTTVLSQLTQVFTERGYKVLVVPESATELIPNGIVPGMLGMSMEEFQRVILCKQINKEELYDTIALNLEKDYGKVLVLCDRGLMDGQAYVSREDFDKALGEFFLSRSDAFSRYDGVIHLVTAAKAQSAGLYTTENNAARRETAEEAIEVDDKTLAAWVGCPHLRAIQPQDSFEEKLALTIKEVCAILGDPEPVELEHKYLIDRPDETLLEKYGAQKNLIVQTYLKPEPDTVERRVRQRTMGNGTIFTYTEKEFREDGNGRLERERTITQDEYCKLLLSQDVNCPTVIKTRYCFMYEGRYMELDTFPSDPYLALLEVEVADENEKIVLPSEFKVIREVTDDSRYYNKAIAMNHGRLTPED